MPPKINLIGQRFGRLIVLEQAPNRGLQLAWVCQCDCGALATCRGANLKRGTSTSCGCYQQEIARSYHPSEQTLARIRASVTKHGLTRTRTYRSWSMMHQRCENPRFPEYKRYGAKGTTICERWHSFANFLADMGLRPEGTSIDRKDPYGNYEPDNCRWATPVEQRANQRRNRPVV